MANVNVSEKPAHEIFQELLIIKQKDNEPIDTFIAKKKALFAQLPYNLLESQKLDMIYSTLNDKIQEMVPRDAVQTFDELLEAAKPTQPKKRMRCNFCRHAGHTADECRKKAAPALRLDTDRIPAFWS
ncbi:activity-regulated cytoskeleton associated protein 1-like [Leguminivora glycinivorella]|uniref:activity-regulated cytoskeleton associated protein 1-like n=1 Tax=Leguminivora glycinivorella TaxID=1035111 RepID=UPI00200CA9D6|nr:activity-regulated cytoskeleton associated protein 1-like [Leguminivora glycinivorella]